MLDRNDLYWTELRPKEEGKLFLVKRASDGQISDVTGPEFNVRTRVHEYGGGSYVVSEGVIYFCNYNDQRLYRIDPGWKPRPITPEKEFRYADMAFDTRRGRIICVREDHTVEEREAVNTLVSLDVANNDTGGRVLQWGNDFYSTPRVSPDGSRLCWLTWNHPNMPWDGTELWVGEFTEEGTIGDAERVAGGPEESIFQPEWSPDGTLYFVSDRSGWWNLHRLSDGAVGPVCEMEAEFGKAQWGFRMNTYAFESAERIICSYTTQGKWNLATLDTRTLQLETLETPYTEIWNPQTTRGRVAFLAASAKEPVSLVDMDLATGKFEVVRRASNVEIDDEYISLPEAIEFPTEGGLTAHAFYYRPKNRDYTASSGEKPPLLVQSHGGPTSSTSSTLDLGIQYWTSRGFAVLDVNYGGSTGYGSAYRKRLNGNWGVVDVDDCANGARFLVERGEVDPNRLAITGGSAGGYTTLCALTFRDLFKAGASHFGIGDLEPFAKDTHKFESRYLDRLVGAYPESKELYRERSAINYTDRLSCPVIFFQGLEDQIVPPDQAEMMVDALRKKGLPVAYLPFEGEQHGFRRAENIKRALDAEFYFYSRVFGFEPADDIEPVAIENMSKT
jgi:dipeptidyl aminopeptidase/acylaminoacyl peptidase